MNLYFDYHAANMLTSRIQAIFTDATVDEKKVKYFDCFPIEEGKQKLLEEGWQIIETPVDGFPITLTGKELSSSFGSIDSSKMYYNSKFTLGYNTNGNYMGIVPNYLMSKGHHTQKTFTNHDYLSKQNLPDGEDFVLETTPKKVLFLNWQKPLVRHAEVSTLANDINQYFSCEIPNEKYLLYDGKSRYYLTPEGLVRVSDHWVSAKKISFLDGQTNLIFNSPVAGLLVANNNHPKHSYYGGGGEEGNKAFFKKEKEKLNRVWFNGTFVKVSEWNGNRVSYFGCDGNQVDIWDDNELFNKFAVLYEKD